MIKEIQNMRLSKGLMFLSRERNMKIFLVSSIFFNNKFKDPSYAKHSLFESCKIKENKLFSNDRKFQK